MKLYIYDHCPYCVKARMIFGLKNHPVKLVTLLNDDEKTPISMIGQKMVPILKKTSGEFMAESLDIVRFVDHLTPPTLVSEGEDPFLLELLSRARESYYSLTMPRWVKSDMEEFKTPSAQKYFQDRKEKMIGSFVAAEAETSHYKRNILKILNELETNMKSGKLLKEEEGFFSLNDFHLFAFLRGLSIVKDLPFPSYLKQYMKKCLKNQKLS